MKLWQKNKKDSAVNLIIEINSWALTTNDGVICVVDSGSLSSEPFWTHYSLDRFWLYDTVSFSSDANVIGWLWASDTSSARFPWPTGHEWRSEWASPLSKVSWQEYPVTLDLNRSFCKWTEIVESSQVKFMLLY